MHDELPPRPGAWTREALLRAQIHERDGLFDPDTGEVSRAPTHRLVEDLVSPFSGKLRAYLDFRAIPYRRVRIDFGLYTQGMNRIVGFPIMPVILRDDGRVMQDTTPIIQHLESEYGDPHPLTVPPDPRLAFLMWTLEDFADEYLPRLIMHTRWGTPEARETLSLRIARRLSWSTPEADSAQLATMIMTRQRGFDYHQAITDSARPELDKQIVELLTLLEARLAEHRFLFGDRPSAADFALFGPLWAHLWSDPASAPTMEAHGRRSCDWLDTMHEFGDTRGQVGTQDRLGPWLEFDALPESLLALLRFAAQTHLPNALATARASLARDKRYSVEIRGHSCEFSTYHYRAWSFEQLQRRYADLSEADRAALDPALRDTGYMPDMMAQGVRHNGLYDGLTPPFVVDGVGDARIARRRAKQGGDTR